MKQRRDRQAHRFGAALLGASLVLAGCGSTRSDNEFAQARAAASGGIPAGGNATPSPAPTATGTAPAAEVPAAVPAAASGATGQAPSVGGVSNATTGASGRTAAAVPQGAAPASRVAAGPALAAPSSSAAAGPVAAPRPGEGVPAAPSPVASGPKATIVLGSVGTESGPIGQQLLPLLPAARAWVSDVNARGGLNGHPVKLITGDDGGDPNRALSLARRMVDEDKAVAFYMERMPTTMQAVASFLEERKVPLLGSCNCTDAAARSPMVFEVGPGGGLGFGWAHLAPLLAFSDKRKLAIFYCREVATCTTIRNNVRRLVGPAGVQIVNEAQVTLTQPDYTAEVLAARNAGAEAILLAVDGFSSIRVMRSARRQNYNPEFTMQHGAHDSRFPGAGGTEVEGALISAGLPHWDSPKLADYRTAMAKYYPGAVLGTLSETSWVTGKLMERISTGFGDAVTSQDFLRGLYAFRGETLAGIIPPLSYVEGKGSDENSLCVVPTKLEKGRFVPKNGDEYICAPGWKPVQK